MGVSLNDIDTPDIGEDGANGASAGGNGAAAVEGFYLVDLDAIANSTGSLIVYPAAFGGTGGDAGAGAGGDGGMAGVYLESGSLGASAEYAGSFVLLAQANGGAGGAGTGSGQPGGRGGDATVLVQAFTSDVASGTTIALTARAGSGGAGASSTGGDATLSLLTSSISDATSIDLTLASTGGSAAGPLGGAVVQVVGDTFSAPDVALTLSATIPQGTALPAGPVLDEFIGNTINVAGNVAGGADLLAIDIAATEPGGDAASGAGAGGTLSLSSNTFVGDGASTFDLSIGAIGMGNMVTLDTTPNAYETGTLSVDGAAPSAISGFDNFIFNVNDVFVVGPDSYTVSSSGIETIDFTPQSNAVVVNDFSDGGVTLNFSSYGGALTLAEVEADATNDGVNTYIDIPQSVVVASTANGASGSVAGTGTIELANFTGTLTASNTEFVACYLRGTRILTDRGEIAVEDLLAGDRVVTASGRVRNIVWIGRRTYAGRFAARNPGAWPVLFRPGSLADGAPSRDLRVSPRHAMFLDGLLIPAERLVNGVSILRDEGMETIDYFHIELESHDILIADGALAESFVDDDSRAMFLNAPDRVEGNGGTPAHYCAPRVDGGFALEALRTRLSERAGRRRGTGQTPLRGHIDIAGPRLVEGWAQNPDFPEAPVCLDIYLDGEWIAHTLANLFRPDLLDAGLGSGRHAFSVLLQKPSKKGRPGRIDVRRSSDGADLAQAGAGAFALARIA